jgi:hypothetical protein
MEQVVAYKTHNHLILTEWILAHSAFLVCAFEPGHCICVPAFAFAFAFVAGTCPPDIFLLGSMNSFNLHEQIRIGCADSIGSVINYCTNWHLHLRLIVHWVIY